jgi:hypothetical protein
LDLRGKGFEMIERDWKGRGGVEKESEWTGIGKELT